MNDDRGGSSDFNFYLGAQDPVGDPPDTEWNDMVQRIMQEIYPSSINEEWIDPALIALDQETHRNRVESLELHRAYLQKLDLSNGQMEQRQAVFEQYLAWRQRQLLPSIVITLDVLSEYLSAETAQPLSEEELANRLEIELLMPAAQAVSEGESLGLREDLIGLAQERLGKNPNWLKETLLQKDLKNYFSELTVDQKREVEGFLTDFLRQGVQSFKASLECTNGLNKVLEAVRAYAEQDIALEERLSQAVRQPFAGQSARMILPRGKHTRRLAEVLSDWGASVRFFDPEQNSVVRKSVDEFDDGAINAVVASNPILQQSLTGQSELAKAAAEVEIAIRFKRIVEANALKKLSDPNVETVSHTGMPGDALLAFLNEGNEIQAVPLTGSDSLMRQLQRVHEQGETVVVLASDTDVNNEEESIVLAGWRLEPKHIVILTPEQGGWRVHEPNSPEVQQWHEAGYEAPANVEMRRWVSMEDAVEAFDGERIELYSVTVDTQRGLLSETEAICELPELEDCHMQHTAPGVWRIEGNGAAYELVDIEELRHLRLSREIPYLWRESMRAVPAFEEPSKESLWPGVRVVYRMEEIKGLRWGNRFYAFVSNTDKRLRVFEQLGPGQVWRLTNPFISPLGRKRLRLSDEADDKQMEDPHQTARAQIRLVKALAAQALRLQSIIPRIVRAEISDELLQRQRLQQLASSTEITIATESDDNVLKLSWRLPTGETEEMTASAAALIVSTGDIEKDRKLLAIEKTRLPLYVHQEMLMDTERELAETITALQTRQSIEAELETAIKYVGAMKGINAVTLPMKASAGKALTDPERALLPLTTYPLPGGFADVAIRRADPAKARLLQTLLFDWQTKIGVAAVSISTSELEREISITLTGIDSERYETKALFDTTGVLRRLEIGAAQTMNRHVPTEAALLPALDWQPDEALIRRYAGALLDDQSRLSAVNAYAAFRQSESKPALQALLLAAQRQTADESMAIQQGAEAALSWVESLQMFTKQMPDAERKQLRQDCLDVFNTMIGRSALLDIVTFDRTECERALARETYKDRRYKTTLRRSFDNYVTGIWKGGLTWSEIYKTAGAKPESLIASRALLKTQMKFASGQRDGPTITLFGKYCAIRSGRVAPKDFEEKLAPNRNVPPSEKRLINELLPALTKNDEKDAAKRLTRKSRRRDLFDLMFQIEEARKNGKDMKRLSELVEEERIRVRPGAGGKPNDSDETPYHAAINQAEYLIKSEEIAFKKELPMMKYMLGELFGSATGMSYGLLNQQNCYDEDMTLLDHPIVKAHSGRRSTLSQFFEFVKGHDDEHPDIKWGAVSTCLRKEDWKKALGDAIKKFISDDARNPRTNKEISQYDKRDITGRLDFVFKNADALWPQEGREMPSKPDQGDEPPNAKRKYDELRSEGKIVHLTSAFDGAPPSYEASLQEVIGHYMLYKYQPAKPSKTRTNPEPVMPPPIWILLHCSEVNKDGLHPDDANEALKNRNSSNRVKQREAKVLTTLRHSSRAPRSRGMH